MRSTAISGALVFFVALALVGAAFGDDSKPEASYRRLDRDVVRVYVGDEFFAEYRPDYKGTPIIWPICAPNGALATRAWPMIDDVQIDAEQDPFMKELYRNAKIAERDAVKDHPHHRSLWFNHGAVNGGDFWGGTPATIRQTRLVSVEQKDGDVALVAENAWRLANAKSDVCRDVRAVTFGALPGDKPARFIDFRVEITALADVVVFGDTKEGSFGIRMPSATAVTSKKIKSSWGGTILNDEGEKDDATWSKRSRWVDYSGPAEKFLSGDELDKMEARDDSDFPLTRVGVAVLDGRNSRGERPWRHVRDYGLFASNPFGQHDFEPKTPKADGSLTLKKGETAFFSFRVIFHNGDLTADELEKAFVSFEEKQNAEAASTSQP